MINEVRLVGNLGRDPEIRSMGNGSLVANLSVATSENWKDKQTGEWQERTEWHRVVVFGDGLVNMIKDRCSKGDKVAVGGKLQTRKWTDQSGVEKYTTEVKVDRGGYLKRINTDSASEQGYQAPPDNLDDEIPF